MGMNGRERLVRVYKFRIGAIPPDGVAIRKLDRPGERLERIIAPPDVFVRYNPPEEILIEFGPDARFPVLVEVRTVR